MLIDLLLLIPIFIFLYNIKVNLIKYYIQIKNQLIFQTKKNYEYTNNISFSCQPIKN